MNPPLRPPTGDELRSNAVILQAMEDAWAASLPNDPALRHEEGGWIYMNLTTGDLMIRRAPAGQRAQLDIGNPPLVPGCLVVGTFHTHPNPSAEGWDPGPSAIDQAVHRQLGVPGLISADNGVHITGPESRRGGLAGGPSFPP